MKITLETNFHFPGRVADGEIEVRDGATLRNLLEECLVRDSRGKKIFIDPGINEVDPGEYLVMVNGTAWEFLPKRLETELKDGARVSIAMFLEVLGGG